MVGSQVFLGLLLAHLLGDFPLQTDGVYALKRRSWLGIAVHAGIHGAITCLLLANPDSGWPAGVWVALTHFLVDAWKGHTDMRPRSLGFLVDQALHLVVLATATLCFPALSFRVPYGTLRWLVVLASIPALLTLAALAHDDLRGVATSSDLSPRARGYLRVAHLVGWPLVFVVLLGAWGAHIP